MLRSGGCDSIGTEKPVGTQESLVPMVSKLKLDFIHAYIHTHACMYPNRIENIWEEESN